MFPHVIEVGGKFYVRRWAVFYFSHMGADDHWWMGYPEEWAAFSSPEEARAAYARRKRKFRGFI